METDGRRMNITGGLVKCNPPKTLIFLLEISQPFLLAFIPTKQYEAIQIKFYLIYQIDIGIISIISV